MAEDQVLGVGLEEREVIPGVEEIQMRVMQVVVPHLMLAPIKIIDLGRIQVPVTVK